MALRRLITKSNTGFRALSTSPFTRKEIQVDNVGGHVVHVQLNRPERLNAYTPSLWKETKEVFDQLADDPSCRTIVLSGSGNSFCSGIDLKMGMMEIVKIMQDDTMDIGRKGRLLDRFIAAAQDSFTAIEKCPKPVIAAVHSHCIGAGVDIISGCDIRYASQDAVFSIREVDIGMAADVGTLNRIEHIVGNISWLRELAFTARNVSADEALKYGLVSRVFDSKDRCIEGALDLARLIAEKSPIGVQGTKKVLNYARDHSVADSLEMVRHWNMSQLLSSDLMDGAIAAMEKKKPVFKDV